MVWRMRMLDLDHLEVLLAGAALGARPVRRNVFPSGARCDALLGRTELLVVEPAADQAHVLFHRARSLGTKAVGRVPGRIESNCSNGRMHASPPPASSS